MSKDKLKKLLNELERNYNVKKASDITQDEIFRTGVFSLDYILSGGIHLCEGGHRIEFFGAESSGKTTFALYVIKKYQEAGKVCAFIDSENAYDKEWAKTLGVNNDDLIIVKPDSMEQFGDLMVEIIPKVDLIVIDSIVGLIPEEEIERDTNQPTMGLQARVLALITRKIYKNIIGKTTTMIFINQLREKIGVMYGNPYTTGGGRAIKHMYNTRIQFRAGKPIDVGSGDKKERVGIEINLHCIKNKKGVPYRKAVMDFYFTGHIDNKKSLFFSGIKYGAINLSGKTYTYKDIKIVGKDKFIAVLSDKDWKGIEREIWKRMK